MAAAAAVAVSAAAAPPTAAAAAAAAAAVAATRVLRWQQRQPALSFSTSVVVPPLGDSISEGSISAGAADSKLCAKRAGGCWQRVRPLAVAAHARALYAHQWRLRPLASGLRTPPRSSPQISPPLLCLSSPAPPLAAAASAHCNNSKQSSRRPATRSARTRSSLRSRPTRCVACSPPLGLAGHLHYSRGPAGVAASAGALLPALLYVLHAPLLLRRARAARTKSRSWRRQRDKHTKTPTPPPHRSQSTSRRRARARC